MNSDQYEELCRYFIAEQTHLPVDEVKSVSIPNATRPGLPAYKHQIDLYWETGNDIAKYLNIANAKWRGTERVDQPDVLLLQQVRQSVAAHKAFMITNVGFTAGACAVAKDHGIALHVVKPNFDVSALPRGNRVAIQSALRGTVSQTREPPYSFRVEQRGLGIEATAPRTGPVMNPVIAAPRVAGYRTRVVDPSNLGNRSIGGREAPALSGRETSTRGGSGFERK